MVEDVHLVVVEVHGKKVYITMAFIIIMGICFLEEGTITVVNLLVMYLYQNDIDEREFNQTYKGGFGEPKHKVIKIEISYWCTK